MIFFRVDRLIFIALAIIITACKGDLIDEGVDPPIDGGIHAQSGPEFESKRPIFINVKDTVDEAAQLRTDLTGGTGGEFRVNESGGASYSIPIFTPRGSAGVQPEIAISYTSQRSNGLLGKGWNIDGIEVITRCRQTLIQNGQALPITWSDQDRFCVNGQQLIPTPGAENQFKSEMDNQTVYTLVGDLASPSYFWARSKDGAYRMYGSQQDARRTVYNDNGNTKILAWNLSRVQDSVGNAIDYHYSHLRSESNLSYITYAPKSGSKTILGTVGISNPTVRIDFDYELRPDPITEYVAGYQYVTKMRLNSISVSSAVFEDYAGSDSNSSDSNLLRAYFFNYFPVEDRSTGAVQLSRLRSVEQCADLEKLHCIQPLSFEWGNVPFNKRTIAIEQDSAKIMEHRLADINGDGRLDIIWLESSDESSYSVQYRLFGENTTHTLDWVRDPNKLKVQDFNLDGRTDVALVSGDTEQWSIYFASTSGVSEGQLGPKQEMSPSPVRYVWNNGTLDNLDYIADLNGDGIMDIYELRKNNTLIVRYGERRPSASSDQVYQYTWPETVRTHILPGGGDVAVDTHAVGDFNGDGIMDVVIRRWNAGCTPDDICGDRRVDVFVGDADNNYQYWKNVLTGGEVTDAIWAVDFNRDGLSDLAYRQSGGAVTSLLSTGDGFAALHHNTYTQPFWTVSNYIVGFDDIDGDGYADYWYNVEQGFLYKPWDPVNLYFGKPVLITEDAGKNFFADVDGDNTPDLITLEDDRITINTMAPRTQNLITKIIGAHDATTEISYHSLAQSNDATNPFYHTYQPEIDSPQGFAEAVYEPLTYLPQAHQQVDPLGLFPVLEVIRPVTVVTRVQSDAPTSVLDAKLTVDYEYGLNLLQAGGRGPLGFRTLTTIDGANNIRSTTTYRQDWPFIGQPLRTTRSTDAGKMIQESAIEYRIVNFEDVSSNLDQGSGTVEAGPILVFAYDETSKEYDINNIASMGDNWLKKSVTITEVDEYSNATSVIDTVSDSNGSRFTTRSTNLYGETQSDRQLGRLSYAEVTQERLLADTDSPPSITRASRFTYYPDTGLIHTEMSNIDLSTDIAESTKTYYYDGNGNQIFSKIVGADGSERISDAVVYDSSGRFITESYGIFSKQESADNLVGAPFEYTRLFRESSLSEHYAINRVNEVIEVDEYLNPVNERIYLDTQAYYINTKLFTPMGNKVAQSDELGMREISVGSMSSSPYCTDQTAFHRTAIKNNVITMVECFDKLGRPIRQGHVLMDGSLAFSNTSYGTNGEVQFQTLPSNRGDGERTETLYDTLGRKTQVVSPTGIDRLDYLGFNVVHTNTLMQTRTTLYNALGELISTTNNGDGAIRYEYFADGNLAKVLDPGMNGTQIVYDEFGRKIAIDDPSSGQTFYRYNSLGELTCEQNPIGQITLVQYDARGRMIERTGLDAGGNCESPTASQLGQEIWRYDSARYGLGKLKQVTTVDRYNSRFDQQFTYDRYGRRSIVATDVTALSSQATAATVHYEKTVYDEDSRPWVVYDAARNGQDFTYNATQNVYNQYGYLTKVVDAYNADAVFYEVAEVDERGNIHKSSLGGGILSQSFTYNPLTNQIEGMLTSDLMGQRIQDLSMQWDEIGNLKYRVDAGLKQSGDARFIREDYDYDDLNRLDYYKVSGDDDAVIDPEYNSIGNIVSRSDLGAYQYDESTGGGSYAPSKVGNTTYFYDARGNMMEDSSQRKLSYTYFNKVRLIESPQQTVEFLYGADHARYKRIDTNGQGQKTETIYLGSVEKIRYADGSYQWRRHIQGQVVLSERFNADGSIVEAITQYLIKDHLGSTQTITNEFGGIVYEAAFDPWGKRRNPNATQPVTGLNTSLLSALSEQNGFTGHEMIDGLDIIHMNGRIYDSRIGRFLQVDPVIQSPGESESLNRYSYAWNNPLNAIDPSGYSLKSTWDDLRPYVGTMVAMVLTAYMPAGAGFWQHVVVGTISGTAGALATNQNPLRGALTGAVSAGAFYGVGNAFAGRGTGDGFFYSDLGFGDFTAKVFAHGGVGGLLSVAQGGKFGHGFAAAGVSQAFSGLINTRTYRESRIVLSAAVGGTASRITGGKFANGATVAAFARMFNEEVAEHKAKASVGRDDVDRLIASARRKIYSMIATDSQLSHHTTMGAYIGPEPGWLWFESKGIDVLSIGARIPIDAVGPFKGNVGGMSASQAGALAIFIVSAKPESYVNRLEMDHYKALAKDQNMPVIIEFNWHHNNDAAYIYWTDEKVERYAGGTKY